MQYDSLVISIALIGIGELLLISVFWFVHLKKYKNNPIYHIRNINFWMLSILTSAVAFTTRAIMTYFRANGYISKQLFFIISTFIVIMIGFSFDFGRVLFLWYSLKLQRFEQDSFLKKHLYGKQRDISKTPFLYRNANFFGKPSRAFMVLEIWMFFFWIAYTLTILIADDFELANKILSFSLTFLMIPVLILVFQLWCYNQSSVKSIKKQNKNSDSAELALYAYNTTFRDVFRFRLEITLFLVMFVIILPGVAILQQKYDLTVIDEDGIYAIVIFSLLESISNTISIFIQVFIPYLTFKQNISKFHQANTTNSSISLLDVLSHKYSFFLFIEQLVQELSFENLSFLIEVYQFKNITKDMLKRREKRRQIKQSQISMSMKNEEIKETEVSAQSVTDEFSATFLSSPHSINSKMSGYSQYSQQINGADSLYFSQILCRFPWRGLPLTDTIVNSTDFNKMNQAQNIYDKYINETSYYAINIKGSAFDEVYNRMNELKLWKAVRMNEEEIVYEQNAVKSETDLEMECIKTEYEWNEAMLKVFDYALPDIFQNLEDSMMRFRKTEQFLLLIGSQ